MKKIFAGLLLATLMLSNAVMADELGYVSVSTQIVREVQPDLAEFNINIETRNPNKELAIKENSKNAEAVLNAIKPVLEENAVKTERYSVTPQYRWDNRKQVFETYYVNTTYRVKTQKLDKVQDVMSLALSNGATGTNGLSFSVQNRAKYYDCMYKEAVLENKRKADNVAAALGSKIVGPKSITLSPASQNQVYPSPRTMKLMSANSADGALSESVAPVENGLIKIDVNVDSKFFIK